MCIRDSYGLIRDGAASTLPARILDVLELDAPSGARAKGVAAVTGLRWALGYSPAWRLALARVGATAPPGIHFRSLVTPAPASATPSRHKAA